MRPLKVTARLVDGAKVAGDVPMLDALLEWCMSRHVGRTLHLAHDLEGERAAYQPGTIPSPIVRRRVPGFAWPVPCCSSPIYRVAADAHSHYVRAFRVSPDLIRDDARKVFYTTNGEFKSYRLPLRVRLIDRIVWFCLAKDGRGVKEVRRLLRDVTHLGKKTSQGYGRVAEWIVEDIDQDLSWYAPSDAGSVLMRPMPASAVKVDVIGARRWFGGVVPPYWSREHFTEAVMPC